MIDRRLLIPLARDFAFKAHKNLFAMTMSGLKRYDIWNIQQVADLVWLAGGTDEEIAAAWLHDIIEDTPTTVRKIKEKFGNTVAELVKGLTDLEEFKGLPVAERKQKQTERIKTESPSVRLIKIADQTANIRALEIDPDAWTIADLRDYLEGAKKIVHACQGTNPFLEELFAKVCQGAEERLR